MADCIDVLANIIIQQYFVSSRCLLIFTDEFNTFRYSHHLPAVQIDIGPEGLRSDIFLRYFGCQEIVVKTNRPLWFLKTFEKEIRLSVERFNRRKYLFLQGDTTEENIIEIFELNELDYVSDLVILDKYVENRNENELFFPKVNGVINLWTHKYIGSRNVNDKILLDVWFSENNSFKYEADLYQNKLNNQMGRELKIATFVYEPYTIIGPTVDKHHGSEMSTIIAFTKMYNMTPFPVVNTEDYWGEIFNNWTGKGLLGNLVEDKADIGIAALYTWESSYYFLDLSKPLVRTGITCLVPAPK
ncbi:hypothetical protein NQ318_012987 [Aromia moschata]|uniref:Ionotropic glutamate receptor L-glutamate and glycine-binding domain-containing protein n=1 Tax=Aromia moschata TaxID=1265417 RepID=A0AAV8Y1J2_9CUCU|nr:hypothetical protein NQ318_012987 [Aromia moschata]